MAKLSIPPSVIACRHYFTKVFVWWWWATKNSGQLESSFILQECIAARVQNMNILHVDAPFSLSGLMKALLWSSGIQHIPRHGSIDSLCQWWSLHAVFPHSTVPVAACTVGNGTDADILHLIRSPLDAHNYYRCGVLCCHIWSTCHQTSPHLHFPPARVQSLTLLLQGSMLEDTGLAAIMEVLVGLADLIQWEFPGLATGYYHSDLLPVSEFIVHFQ